MPINSALLQLIHLFDALPRNTFHNEDDKSINECVQNGNDNDNNVEMTNGTEKFGLLQAAINSSFLRKSKEL